MASMHDQPVDEEAAAITECRFSATSPLARLRSLLPVALNRSASPDPRDLPTTSTDRRRASSVGASLDQDEFLSEKVTEQQEKGTTLSDTIAAKETVLYLAYGSNLSSKTFRGVRNIKPLSQIAVLVPELRLTFDLPGIPYAEPCFAGTQFRDPDAAEEQDGASSEDDSLMDGVYMSEKEPLMVETREVQSTDLHRNRWHKPLVGVVYEVTLADYAIIIATEGGGRGYRDVVVDCHAFSESYKPTDPVPNHPDTPPFKAHTLLSPAADEALKKRTHAIKSDHSPAMHNPRPTTWCLGDIGPHLRPDGEYAQPSARYLNLLITGAAEHELPVSYQEYLSQIRPYRITEMRQKIGKGVFLAIWAPPILSLLALGKFFAGPDGRSPPWLVILGNVLFTTMWKSYDNVFKPVFGDGERTLHDTPPL
ncbi:uncharacterized protein N7477_006142 [Penicillium maclennaniae]|uniref:uncharacterized protein n=1 Tax=Penicillium maclennaniae TaxID=1343394 RepID=UPI0025419197|nr:uncharacterized protein N7477_006142 [Penicillium maclennaniae]KAJ5670779.1 hypothetical protein N7477_006142 [Penicillium maclennaniae]